MDSIRLDRVLLIVNSDSAQSLNDAQDYATRRSLIGGHVLAFNFGLANANTKTLSELNGITAGITCQTEGAYLGLYFVRAVRLYCTDNGIDAVIVSTFTPCKVSGFAAPYSLAVYPLAAVAGFSLWFDGQQTMPPAHFDPFVNTVDSIDAVIAGAPATWRPLPVTPRNTRNPSRLIPHGRLGAPNYISTSVAEVGLRGGATSVYDNAVTTALAGELVDNTLGEHCLTETLNYSVITAAKNKLAVDRARQLAMPTVRNMGVDYQMSEASGGSITVPNPVFATCLATPFNPNGFSFGGPLADSFSCAAGAWGFIWTSGAGAFGGDLLYDGGAAAVMTSGEPYADGMPEPQDLFILATHYQIPLMLAHFLARGNGAGSTVCGDPLYAPYKSTNVTPPKPWSSPHQ